MHAAKALAALPAVPTKMTAEQLASYREVSVQRIGFALMIPGRESYGQPTEIVRVTLPQDGIINDGRQRTLLGPKDSIEKFFVAHSSLALTLNRIMWHGAAGHDEITRAEAVNSLSLRRRRWIRSKKKELEGTIHAFDSDTLEPVAGLPLMGEWALGTEKSRKLLTVGTANGKDTILAPAKATAEQLAGYKEVPVEWEGFTQRWHTTDQLPSNMSETMRLTLPDHARKYVIISERSILGSLLTAQNDVARMLSDIRMLAAGHNDKKYGEAIDKLSRAQRRQIDRVKNDLTGHINAVDPDTLEYLDSISLVDEDFLTTKEHRELLTITTATGQSAKPAPRETRNIDGYAFTGTKQAFDDYDRIQPEVLNIAADAISRMPPGLQIHQGRIDTHDFRLHTNWQQEKRIRGLVGKLDGQFHVEYVHTGEKPPRLSVIRDNQILGMTNIADNPELMDLFAFKTADHPAFSKSLVKETADKIAGWVRAHMPAAQRKAAPAALPPVETTALARTEITEVARAVVETDALSLKKKGGRYKKIAYVLLAGGGGALLAGAALPGVVIAGIGLLCGHQSDRTEKKFKALTDGYGITSEELHQRQVRLRICAWAEKNDMKAPELEAIKAATPPREVKLSFRAHRLRRKLIRHTAKPEEVQDKSLLGDILVSETSRKNCNTGLAVELITRWRAAVDRTDKNGHDALAHVAQNNHDTLAYTIQIRHPQSTASSLKAARWARKADHRALAADILQEARAMRRDPFMSK